MSKCRFKVLSLFSGAGGLDLGFEQAGCYDLTVANDIIRPPAETYSVNFRHKILEVGEDLSAIGPHSYIVKDISRIDFDDIKKLGFDVVIGGPPCQDFSVVRGPSSERQGISVKRGMLYAHFVRALVQLQPKAFVFENVAGLVSANKGLAYQTILQDFSGLGKNWTEIKRLLGGKFGDGVKNYAVLFSGVVDAASVGVPQRRRRLIVVGFREDVVRRDWATAGRAKAELERQLSGGDLLFQKYPLAAMEVFEGLPLPDLQGVYKEVMMEYAGIAEKVGTHRALEWRREVWDRLSFDAVEDYLLANGIKAADMQEIERAFEQHERLLKELGYYGRRLEAAEFEDGSNAVPSEKAEVVKRMMMIPPDENCEFVRGTEWEVEGRRISLIYRRLHPLKPAYTVVAYGGGGTWGYHYRRGRSRLTNRERARLQTFPDSFRFVGSEQQVRAQIGEAVPPLLARRIAEAIASALRVAEGG